MSAAQHTPGPWSTTTPDDTFITSEGRDIAEIIGDYRVYHEVMEADARLIAAAPEMLEALEGCLRTFVRFRLHGSTPAEDEAIDAALETAADAILKATGGAA